jgi:ATP/maltotriose-dependent transcriptional regulator MalT
MVDQAERLMTENVDPDRVAAMALQGIRDDEWRLQRIRPFDWYGVAYKRQAQTELQAKYWRVWSIQVRCERRAGRSEKAVELLAEMEQRAAALEKHSDPVYWDALTSLVLLYEEGNQEEAANRKLDSMQQFLARNPDPQRTAQVENLRRHITTR